MCVNKNYIHKEFQHLRKELEDDMQDYKKSIVEKVDSHIKSLQNHDKPSRDTLERLAKAETYQRALSVIVFLMAIIIIWQSVT